MKFTDSSFDIQGRFDNETARHVRRVKCCAKEGYTVFDLDFWDIGSS